MIDGTDQNIEANALDEFRFNIVENKLIETYEIAEHYMYKIKFFLLKVDDWNGDVLDIYLNDLLVRRNDFAPTGNMVCEK